MPYTMQLSILVALTLHHQKLLPRIQYKTQFFPQEFPCYISLPDTSVPHLIHHNELVRFLIFAQHTSVVVIEAYDKNKNYNNCNDVEINNYTQCWLLSTQRKLPTICCCMWNSGTRCPIMHTGMYGSFARMFWHSQGLFLSNKCPALAWSN